MLLEGLSMPACYTDNRPHGRYAAAGVPSGQDAEEGLNAAGNSAAGGTIEEQQDVRGSVHCTAFCWT